MEKALLVIWDTLWQWASAMALPFTVALVARGAWYAEQIRKGNRPLAVGLLIGEGLTAWLCAIVGRGIADYFVFSENAALALIGVLAWLGPGGTFALLRPIIERRLGGKSEP